jgi:hypothetical protein
MTDAAPATSSSSARSALTSSFVVVAVILLVAAVSINAATEFLQLSFQKQPVPLRKDLKTVPEKLGPWVQVSTDQAANEDLEHALGTKLYIFRDYVDSRLVSQKDLDAFRGRTPDERRIMAAELQYRYPRAVVNLAVTYYTGLVDTVAHIPDRCYIADGFEPTHYDLKKWSAFEGRSGRDRDYDVRFITFENQAPNRAAIPQNVAYVFQCNGDYTSDPLGVRRRLADLFAKYGYYAKIEMKSADPDRARGEAAMNDLLSFALPQVEQCLPDWQSVVAQDKDAK